MEDVVDGALHSCDSCKQTFNCATRLANHKLKCGGITCSNCGKRFKQMRELNRHQKKSTNIISCDHCDRKFCTEYEYQKHKRQVKPVTPSSDDAIHEEIFPSIFEGVDGYESVKRSNHQLIQDFIDKKRKYMVINKEIHGTFT